MKEESQCSGGLNNREYIMRGGVEERREKSDGMLNQNDKTK